MIQPRVCFTSKSSAGSWIIRGEQMAGCRPHWTATHELTRDVLANHDVFCLVKRTDPATVEMLRKKGKIVIFDIVDSWAQPADDVVCDNLDKAKAFFSKQFAAINAHAYIFPNARMAADLGGLVECSTFIYHHYRPGLSPIYIKERPLRIGYEGSERYLGKWKPFLENLAPKLGMEFVVNPEDYSTLDIGFAARGGEHDSFLSNHYKSNVKMANFYGAALPCVVSAKETACQETDCGDVRFFRTEEELEAQLRALLDFDTRAAISERFIAARGDFEISKIAQIYETFFDITWNRFKKRVVTRVDR